MHSFEKRHFLQNLGKTLETVLCALAEEKGFASVVPTFKLLLFGSAAVLEGQLSTWDPAR